MKMNRRTFAASSAASAGLIASGGPLAAAMKDPVVETTHGKVRGAVEKGIYAFKGIPYGADTGGANRFLPPRPAAPWAGVREATTMPNLAPQGQSTANPASGMGSDMSKFFGTGAGYVTTVSEDCLQLNVYTAGLNDGGKRPIMVWIHGGGFSIGGGSGPRTDGHHLASRHGVVSVNMNHRLGAMGYGYLGAFDPEYARSGNQGQLDLLLALQWVRDNAVAFGGDPDRIMIHGESGGGGKIGTILAMPGFDGSYRSAILQSGTANRLPTTDMATEATEALLKQLGIARADWRKLLDTPWSDVVKAQAQLEISMRTSGYPRRGFVPTVGTPDLPIQPIEAAAKGAANLPVIIGNTAHEMATMLMGAGLDLSAVTDDVLKQRMQGVYRDKATEALDAYRALHPDYSPGDLLVRAMTDQMRQGGIELAEVRAAAGSPTWQYLFAWESPVLPKMKAAHGIDGAFYFDNTDAIPITQDNPVATRLATIASSTWANFAATGVPAAKGLPAWPQYSVPERATMVFDAQPHVESDPLGADRALREKLAPQV